jgi:cytochrome c peroxidase
MPPVRWKLFAGSEAYFVACLCLSACSPAPTPSPFPSPGANWPAASYPADNTFTEARWELGRDLFFDPILSIDGEVSCASCHEPAHFFATNDVTNSGAFGAPGTRNVPSLTNLAYHPHFTREAGVPTLEMQVLVPVQEANELGHNIVLIADTLAQIPAYVSKSMAAYGVPPSPFVVTRALAAFERSLFSANSPYDKFLAGDYEALGDAAQRGLTAFTELGCEPCHSGPFFSDFEPRNNGLYEVYQDSGRYRLTLDPLDIGVFKTPSLRNVAATGPYMHDGSLGTLDDVISHYLSGGAGHANQDLLIQPHAVPPATRTDLIAFLESLTDAGFLDWAEEIALETP